MMGKVLGELLPLIDFTGKKIIISTTAKTTAPPTVFEKSSPEINFLMGMQR